LWGYAICDAALRTHVDAKLQAELKIEIAPSSRFPFAGGY
jgi:NTE family protein